MSDTTPAAAGVLAAAIRAIPPAERFLQMLEASDWHRRWIVTGLRRRYPDATDLELIELVLGRELVPRGRDPRGTPHCEIDDQRTTHPITERCHQPQHPRAKP